MFKTIFVKRITKMLEKVVQIFKHNLQISTTSLFKISFAYYCFLFFLIFAYFKEKPDHGYSFCKHTDAYNFMKPLTIFFIIHKNIYFFFHSLLKTFTYFFSCFINLSHAFTFALSFKHYQHFYSFIEMFITLYFHF